MFSLEMAKVKLYDWTAQPRPPILLRVIRAFTVDRCFFCSHSTTAASAIVTGTFPLDWSRFSPLDWERQWHAPTYNECTRDVSAWCLSPRFLPRFLNQYLSRKWAPRSLPHISGEQEVLWPVVLVWVLKEGIRRSRAQTLNQWPYPTPSTHSAWGKSRIYIRRLYLFTSLWPDDPFFPSIFHPTQNCK